MRKTTTPRVRAREPLRSEPQSTTNEMLTIAIDRLHMIRAFAEELDIGLDLVSLRRGRERRQPVHRQPKTIGYDIECQPMLMALRALGDDSRDALGALAPSTRWRLDDDFKCWLAEPRREEAQRAR